MTTPGVVAVLAGPEACDRLESPAGAALLRVAPREVLIIGAADTGAVRAAVAEPTAIVDDVSDGWAGFVLEGDGVRDAFARLSELELPAEGWVQGEVARAAAKVIVERDRLTVLVPAMLAVHVEQRIRADAAEVLTA